MCPKVQIHLMQINENGKAKNVLGSVRYRPKSKAKKEYISDI